MEAKKEKNRNYLTEEAVVVYMPTKMKQRWKDFANKNTMTLSKFVRSVVNDYLFLMAKENTGIPREKLMSRIKELEEENRELKNEKRLLKILSTNLDAELKMMKLRHLERQDPIKVDKTLINLLKGHGAISMQDMLRLLDIPVGDMDAISLLNKQLEILQYHSLVTYDGRRWMWNVA